MEGGCCRARRLWSCEMPKGKKCIPGRGEAVPLSARPSVPVTRRARKPREGGPVLAGQGLRVPRRGEAAPILRFPAGPRPPATPPQPSAGRGAAAEGPGQLRGSLRSPSPAGSRGTAAGPSEHPGLTARSTPALPPAPARPHLRCRGSPGSLRRWHLLLRAGSCWQRCSGSEPEACPWRAGTMRPLFYFFLQGAGWLIFT